MQYASTSGNDSSSVLKLYSKPSLYYNLFDGVLPSLIGGIPAGALFFATKDFMKEYLQLHPVAGIIFSKEFSTALAVVVANIPYWVVRNPAEVLKTRAQVADVCNSVKNRDSVTENCGSDGARVERYDDRSIEKLSRRATFSGVQEIWQSQGFSGVFALLYGSYASNIAYALPADVIKFVACEFPKMLQRG